MKETGVVVVVIPVGFRAVRTVEGLLPLPLGSLPVWSADAELESGSSCEAAAVKAWFTARSIAGVGPPAPAQKSRTVWEGKDDPKIRSRIWAVWVAGEAGWMGGRRVVQRWVRMAWTRVRRKGGNLGGMD